MSEEIKRRDLAKRSLFCQSDASIASNKSVNDFASLLVVS